MFDPQSLKIERRVEKAIEEEIIELKNYRADYLMAKTIMLTYMDDDLTKFFENYKTIKEMFDVINVRYSNNIATHMKLLP